WELPLGIQLRKIFPAASSIISCPPRQPPAGLQRQGASVSISADGNTAISAAPSAGASWVFTRSNGIWSQQAELAKVGSVALSSDGNTAIVGAIVGSASRAGVER